MEFIGLNKFHYLKANMRIIHIAEVQLHKCPADLKNFASVRHFHSKVNAGWPKTCNKLPWHWISWPCGFVIRDLLFYLKIYQCLFLAEMLI